MQDASTPDVSTDSYASISRALSLDETIPFDEDWSAAPDFLRLIMDYALQQHPGVIVECSSGTSTLVLARCCQLNGGGHVTSLENGARFAEQTRHNLEVFGLQEFASVLHAPLVTYRYGDESYQWYDTRGLGVDTLDMLVVDGPPGFLQSCSRFPALPELRDRMSRDCSVFLDDAAREDEALIVSRWMQQYDGIAHRFIGNERGCSVLSLR